MAELKITVANFENEILHSDKPIQPSLPSFLTASSGNSLF
jgi:hypothetical protein